METFSSPTIVRPTRRAWIGRNCSCISRHNCCKTSTPGHSGLGLRKGVCTLLLTKSILGHPGWLRAGYQGCVSPGQIKCFLDSGVRRCNVGHSCMRRVIDCSSVPHKMARRSVAQAIRAVSRLVGLGCEFFDISVCFKSWIHRLRGAAGGSLVLSLQMLINVWSLLCPSVETHLPVL